MEPKILKDTGNGQPDLRQAVSEGLLYAHSRLNANTAKTLEAASILTTPF
jgi:hypothetical protein